MRDELLLYYEKELTYLRKTATQFAEKYPKIASRLLLEPDLCADPHVERLLEGFAFLAARVHLKIDDEFPEISEALLSIVYPHLVRPIPSMAIVEFQLDPDKGKLTTGLEIARGTTLYSKPVNGIPCKFRTAYDTVLWPVSVANAEWRSPDQLTPPLSASGASGAIRIELRCPSDLQFSKLHLDRLRFHLSGEGAVVNTIYEMLGCNLTQIVVRDPTPGTRIRPVFLDASNFRAVGFEEDEGMLPYSRRSFVGYRLLQEYFTFPDKFHFVDISGLAGAWASGFKDRAELILLFSGFENDYRQRLELGISGRTFRLGCAPAINLFPHTCEPIRLDQRKFEYQVVPDVRRPLAMEIFSVDEVASLDGQTKEAIYFEPFYSFRHASRRQTAHTFWLANRRLSSRPHDDGTDIMLSFTDLTMRPVQPDNDTITVRTTCTNRDLPSRLPFGNEDGDFEIETLASIKKITSLHKPTDPTRPMGGKAGIWRLISQLSLNYLSIVEGGKDALQQILMLYNFTDSAFSRKIIEGILDVRSERHFARVVSENGISFARGTRVHLDFDEEQYVGNGVYLFASVLEHFLALYCSLNSFSQLSVTTKQRKGELRAWPPRAGRKILM
jgi:type VI secretion system protein ImpG